MKDTELSAKSHQLLEPSAEWDTGQLATKVGLEALPVVRVVKERVEVVKDIFLGELRISIVSLKPLDGRIGDVVPSFARIRVPVQRKELKTICCGAEVKIWREADGEDTEGGAGPAIAYCDPDILALRTRGEEQSLPSRLIDERVSEAE